MVVTVRSCAWEVWVLAESRSWYDAPPSAARLTGSLRDIGYDFPTAVADLVDNSISAGAKRVGVELRFEPNNSHVLIWDDGEGMTPNKLLEALRFGSRRDYRRNELGRFGLGLKTGSFSQCRRLSVVSRTAPQRPTCHVRTLDLDYIERFDSWSVLADERGDAIDRAKRILRDGSGTVVVWEDLDRVLPDRYAESGWGRRRLNTLAKKTADHLSMVFHRFIAGTHGLDPVAISVNEEKLQAWEPFASSEQHVQALPAEIFEVESTRGTADVTFTGYVLPPKHLFSSPEQFDRMSGPLKWNRQQGLYIYRANRLVQFGGWNGVRGIDEHTKLARASIDFDTDLDETFQINVAKMSVVLPASLRNMLQRPIHDLCVRADAAYRQAATISDGQTKSPGSKAGNVEGVALKEVGIALKAALLESEDLPGLTAAVTQLRVRHPDLVQSLGL